LSSEENEGRSPTLLQTHRSHASDTFSYHNPSHSV